MSCWWSSHLWVEQIKRNSWRWKIRQKFLSIKILKFLMTQSSEEANILEVLGFCKLLKLWCIEKLTGRHIKSPESAIKGSTTRSESNKRLHDEFQVPRGLQNRKFQTSPRSFNIKIHKINVNSFNSERRQWVGAWVWSLERLHYNRGN